MIHFTKHFVPITTVCLFGISIYFGLVSSKGGAPNQTAKRQKVDVLEVQKIDYQVHLLSQGTVVPHTKTTLTSEVSGKIISIAPAFLPGEFFQTGDVLLSVEPEDYETSVIVARAELAREKTLYAEEQARSDQAAENWKSLRKNEAPTALALRKPQLAEAKANVDAAQARLLQAERLLERTKIRTPYRGRIMSKMADLGQYVTPGTELAEIYATDYVEVVLPLASSEIQLIDIPNGTENELTFPLVTLSTTINSRQLKWKGRIVGTTGSVDPESRQFSVIARIDNPFDLTTSTSATIAIGMFLQAEIQGKILRDVYQIPKSAIRSGNLAYFVDDRKNVYSKPLEALWSDSSNLIVSVGIHEGERLIVSNANWLVPGAPVEVRKVHPFLSDEGNS